MPTDLSTRLLTFHTLQSAMIISTEKEEMR